MVVSFCTANFTEADLNGLVGSSADLNPKGFGKLTSARRPRFGLFATINTISTEIFNPLCGLPNTNPRKLSKFDLKFVQVQPPVAQL